MLAQDFCINGGGNIRVNGNKRKGHSVGGHARNFTTSLSVRQQRTPKSWFPNFGPQILFNVRCAKKERWVSHLSRMLTFSLEPETDGKLDGARNVRDRRVPEAAEYRIRQVRADASRLHIRQR